MSQAKTVKEVLIATEYILNHLDWTQNAFFRDSVGRTTMVQEDAKACCLSGALRLVDDEPYQNLKHKARNEIQAVIGDSYSITTFNDKPGRTKEEVLEVVRKAIQVFESAS